MTHDPSKYTKTVKNMAKTNASAFRAGQQAAERHPGEGLLTRILRGAGAGLAVGIKSLFR